MNIGTYEILLIFSAVIIISYVFDQLTKWIKVPSTLLLIGLGILTKNFLPDLNIHTYLELFGVAGLILIVLDASLKLKVSKETLPLIKDSFLSAFVILFATMMLISYIIFLMVGGPFLKCMINAIPLSIISSAIAIPSVHALSQKKRDFIIYESTFSDIMGILIFNMIVTHMVLSFMTGLSIVAEILLFFFISLVCCLLFMLFIQSIHLETRFLLVIALLVFIYTAGKRLHYSPLLLILIFGLVMNNLELIPWRLKKFLRAGTLSSEIEKFKLILSELTFLVRTFFFILLGYSFNLKDLMNADVWMLGMLIVAAIFIIRYLYLRFIVKMELVPEIFIFPRGLISVILFYAIPKAMLIPNLSKELLLFVIISTSILMTVGLVIPHKAEPEEQPSVVEVK
ncbi:MAG: cation:proton antiporter [bacterium]